MTNTSILKLPFEVELCDSGFLDDSDSDSIPIPKVFRIFMLCFAFLCYVSHFFAVFRIFMLCFAFYAMF